MIRPKNETEGLLPSLIKSCQRLIEQTHNSQQKLLEFKLIKAREIFSFEPLFILGLDTKWMIGPTSFEVWYSTFNIPPESNKFELYTDLFEELSFTELKHEVEEKTPQIPTMTNNDLQGTMGPHIIK